MAATDPVAMVAVFEEMHMCYVSDYATDGSLGCRTEY